MKRIFLAILTIAVVAQSVSASNEIIVKPNLTGVKVFLRGAELKQNAKVKLEKGINEVVISGIAGNIDRNSINVSGKGLTYGVKFPMLAKSDVVGSGTNPLYKQLASLTGEKPKWNFHKYLIDRSGQKVLSFPSSTAPDNKTFVGAVERALAERP